MRLSLPTTLRLIIGFGLAVAIVLCVGFLSYRSSAHSLASARSVARIYENISTLEETLSLVESAETSERGYLVTGQERYVRESMAVRPDIGAKLDRLDQLLNDNVTQKRRLADLRQAITLKLADVDRLLHLRATVGFEGSRDELGRGVGRDSMDQVRDIIGALKQDEVSLLDGRARRSDADARWSILSVTIGVVVDVLLLLAILGLILYDLSRRRQLSLSLTAARDEAIRSADSRAHFLTNVSHEIRTPLNAILGFTSLLLDSKLDRRERELALNVRNGGETLLAIVNGILDFSQIESGELLIEPVDFDLRETVDSVVHSFSAGAHVKKLDLGLMWDPSLPDVVRGDSGHIRQILANLISNAVKFTEHGEVVVSVKPEPAQGFVRFSVSDSGVGISAADQKRLFRPFSQADASSTRQHGGTGLGLRISKDLAEMLGGKLEMLSEPGKGSTFSFSIPLEKPVAPRDTLRPFIAGLAGFRVLVVDDGETNRRVLLHDLTSWRMEGDDAANGAEALAKLRQAAVAGRPFDLAIIDSVMPELDGVVLSRLIKSDKAISETRLVLLAAVSERFDRAVLTSVGIDSVVTKPPTQSSLFDALANAISGPAIEEAREESSQIRRPIRSDVRVLVAEDNAMNQKLALLQLEALGFRVDMAWNGVEALEALARIPYDLVLMDCQMPQMDGFDAAREIRLRETSGVRLPIIAMTANAFGGDRERCLAAGMDDYISKPVEIEDLGRLLDRWLPPPADDPLDAKVLQSLRKLALEDYGVIGDVVVLYAHDSMARIADIQAAFDGGNASALAEAAHALKSTSGSIGAARVKEIAFALEKLGRELSIGDAQSLIDKLQHQNSLALERLRHLVPPRAPAQEVR